MTLSEAITVRIKQLCKKRDISINKLAILADIPQSTLSSIINGTSKAPNLLTVYKLATYFNMTVSEFLDIPALNERDILDE